MPSVLFVCVANSFRSQMAEAAAKSMVDGQWEVWSAGSAPGGHIHPLAMQLMEEVGLDLQMHRSKGLHEVPQRTWDYLVAMGCGDRCPAVHACHRIEWNIPDPAGRSLEEGRRIRDQLMGAVRDLIGSRDTGR